MFEKRDHGIGFVFCSLLGLEFEAANAAKNEFLSETIAKKNKSSFFV